MWPRMAPSFLCSTEMLTRASSPKIDLAYKFAAKKFEFARGAIGVRILMFVMRAMCRTKSAKEVMEVLTVTLFSHSKSAHMDRKTESEHTAGEM